MLTSMHHFMFLQVSTLSESFVANCTGEWFHIGVHHLMFGQIGSLREPLITNLAGVRFLARMDQVMLQANSKPYFQSNQTIIKII